MALGLIALLFVLALPMDIPTSLADLANSNALAMNSDVDWWPMFCHDLRHTGYSTSKAPNNNQTLWNYTITGSPMISSVAVADGKVFAGSDNLYALDANTGTQIWSYTTEENVLSSPAVADGKVFISWHLKVYTFGTTLTPVTVPKTGMALEEEVMVYSDGSAEMLIEMTIPRFLSDEAFGVNMTSVPLGTEIPIPETKTIRETIEAEEDVKDISLEGDINSDGTVNIKDLFLVAKVFGSSPGHERWNHEADVIWDGNINIKDIFFVAKNFERTRPPRPELVVPVREDFHRAITMEQAVLHGFQIEVVDSKMIEDLNDTAVSVYAESLEFAKPIGASTWRIDVGPQDENAVDIAAEFMFTKIQFIQLMLRSLPGEQIYEGTQSMLIILPYDVEWIQILNREELIGLEWKIDFGGGTFMEASITHVPWERPYIVVVEETVVVTEQNITATEGYLWDALSQYKVFKIDYEIIGSSSQAVKMRGLNEPENDWSTDWEYTITLGYSKTWIWEDKITASVRVTPSLKVQWHMEWDLSGWDPERFNTWIKITPSIIAEAYASAKGTYTKTWSHTFATWSHRFSFWIGALPVWTNLKLTVTGEVTVEAHGSITLMTSVNAYAWFKGEVEWTKTSGWEGSFEKDKGAQITEPRITATGGASITPSVKLRLAFLFYDVAGPYIEGVPYAPISLNFNPNTWSIELKFKIFAGCTFAGWIKDLLGLTDYSITLKDWTLASEEGTW